MSEKGKGILVVCGHGMVAQRFLEELTALAPEAYASIVVFNGESRAAYNRIQLSALLAGDTDEASLSLQTEHWYRQHQIRVHDGEPVRSIDRKHRTVTTATGRVQRYDTLVLATGARPSRLGIPGEELEGVRSFRDLEDTRALIDHSTRHHRAVVVGGGFLGLEAADGLRRRGMDVTVLHRGPHLLNRQLDPVGGERLAEALQDQGLSVRTGTAPLRLLGRGQVRAVQLDDETLLSADLVLIATGIAPNLDLAREAGLCCDRGIAVTDQLQTSDPDIYAVGECCQLGDQTFGLVEPGYQQAAILARVLTDATGQHRYTPSNSATRLKISDIPVFSCGQHCPDEFTESLVWQDLESGAYSHLMVRDNRLVGAVLVGNTLQGPWFQHLIAEGSDITAYRPQLPFGKPFCQAAA
jgi:nitrite reductase (NADH) large subunit